VTTTVQLPFEQPSPLQVSPLLRRLQVQSPIHRVRTAVGDEGWLVTGYAEVRRLLDDERLGRSHPDPATAARTGESAIFGGPLGDFDTEHADHARMRSLLRPHFTPAHMRALHPRVDELTRQLLDELAQQQRPTDLVQDLAVPLPIAVICELLGVPFEDRARFRAWTQAAADIRDRSRSEQGLAELFGYGLDLVARKRRDPADDVLTRLATTEGVDDSEAAMLGMSLLFAGHETTVVTIGLGAAALLAHPEQWQALRQNPEHVTTAVEEILRTWGAGGSGIPRYARSDLDIDDTAVRAGELVLLDISAANHDPAAFDEPDCFDLTRPGPTHVAFGYGSRYCLGAPLARVELQAVFAQLVARFPTMRLAVGLDELRINAGVLTGGLVDLPVTW
jgi:pentalenolactone synthase